MSSNQLLAPLRNSKFHGCSCGDSWPTDYLFSCIECKALHCPACVKEELDGLFCSNCLEYAHANDVYCPNCYLCPVCGGFWGGWRFVGGKKVRCVLKSRKC